MSERLTPATAEAMECGIRSDVRQAFTPGESLASERGIKLISELMSEMLGIEANPREAPLRIGVHHIVSHAAVAQGLQDAVGDALERGDIKAAKTHLSLAKLFLGYVQFDQATLARLNERFLGDDERAILAIAIDRARKAEAGPVKLRVVN